MAATSAARPCRPEPRLLLRLLDLRLDVATSARTSSSSRVAKASTRIGVARHLGRPRRPAARAHRASTSRIPARNRLPSPSPVEDAGDQAGDVHDLHARRGRPSCWRSSRPGPRGAGRAGGPRRPTVSVVVKGWAPPAACPPVRALNNDVLPDVGQTDQPESLHRSLDATREALGRCPVAWPPCRRRTTKRKIRAKKKANHGKRPNAGRG